MQIGSFGGVAVLVRHRATGSFTRPDVPVPGLATRPRGSADLRAFLGRLGDLRGQLSSLEQGRILDGTGLAGFTAAGSTAPLGLSFGGSAAILASDEEMATASTSFTPRQPGFAGLSTAIPSIAGIYDGDQGDDTLSFRAVDSAVVGGAAPLRIDVLDGGGGLIERVDFQGLAPDTPLALTNGLTLALSSGVVVTNDSFTVDVFTSVPSSVDPDRPFNGAGNDVPGFDPGEQVTAGSFDVNGVTIAVAADDTLADVLASITASAANVTATHDAAGDRIVLTQDTPGAAPTVVVGNDTSGFLSATKLDAASVVPGLDGDDARVIEQVPALSGIASGTFSINGYTLNVDIAADSLSDVVSQINASGADVAASLGVEGLQIRSTVRGRDLELVDGTSGFFSALAVPPGRIGARSGDADAPRVFEREAGTARSLRGLAGALERLVTRHERDAGDRLKSELTERLGGALADAFERVTGKSILDSRARSGLGLDFDLRGGGEPLLGFDGSGFRSALGDATDFESLVELLFGDGGPGQGEGLVGDLLAIADDLEARVRAALDAPGDPGALLDTLV